ncbi:hypothetical protein DBA29_21665 [Xenophilus aerolatus]|nr:hypothetical protein [Xenophilus aerolatus]
MATDPVQPLQALQAAMRPAARPTARPQTLLIAGATGALGSELVRRLAGTHRYAHTRVLTGEPMHDGLRGVESVTVPAAEPVGAWPAMPHARADVAVVAFDPPRLYHGRERALWAPQPAQLGELARWLQAQGVRTLAVVQPHDQGSLPEALKHGLATMDEHALAALDFTSVLILRTARKPAALKLGLLERLAAWMLSVTRFMVPSTERPVRGAKVAELLDVALQIAPPGVHVAAPEVVWAASQGHTRAVAERWLLGNQGEGSDPVPAKDAWKAV